MKDKFTNEVAMKWPFQYFVVFFFHSSSKYPSRLRTVVIPRLESFFMCKKGPSECKLKMSTAFSLSASSNKDSKLFSESSIEVLPLKLNRKYFCKFSKPQKQKIKKQNKTKQTRKKKWKKKYQQIFRRYSPVKLAGFILINKIARYRPPVNSSINCFSRRLSAKIHQDCLARKCF